MFGTLTIVSNVDQKVAAATTYNAVCVLNEFGEYETLLLTETDLIKFRDRAVKNPEDAVTLPWVTRAALWVLRALRIL